MSIAAFGVLGVVAASLVSFVFDWRSAYILVARLGFLLLVLR